MLELYFHVQAFSGLRVEFNFDFCMFFKWCICLLVIVNNYSNKIIFSIIVCKQRERCSIDANFQSSYQILSDIGGNPNHPQLR